MERTGDMRGRGSLKRAVAALRRGALVAFPTETFYALGVDPRKPEALDRLRRAKRREPGKPILLIAASASQAFALVRRPLPAPARALSRRFWPGPLTLVLPPRRSDLARSLGSANGVAVRVSAHPLARRLARELGFPITGTSANQSGEAPARCAAEIAPSVRRRLEVVLEDRKGGSGGRGLPSTILDLTRHPPVVLRAGALAPSRLRPLLREAPGPRRDVRRRGIRARNILKKQRFRP